MLTNKFLSPTYGHRLWNSHISEVGKDIRIFQVLLPTLFEIRKLSLRGDVHNVASE